MNKSTVNGADLNPQDDVSGSSASGFVGNGTDSYTFSGELESLNIDGNATVTLNGETIEPDEYTEDIISFASNGGEFSYVFSANEDVEKSNINGASIDPNDTVRGTTASGQGNGGTDSYSISDEIESLSLNGDATVTLNGDIIDPDDYPDSVVSIIGTGPRVGYSISASGDIEKSTANGADLNPQDEITGSTATGFVGSGTDSYTFSGELVDLAIEDDITVVLNGETIDPDAYSRNVVSFIGHGPRADYSISASESLEKSTMNGADRNPQDEITGSTATGFVGHGIDSYTFTGDLESLSVEDGPEATLNGEIIDPSDYPDNVISFAGQGSYVDYSISVSGDIEKSTANGADFNPQDETTRSTATGFVTSGTDSYVFSGVLELLSFEGDIEVTLNGKPIDPNNYPDSVVSFIGHGPRADYSVSVTGNLEKSTMNGADRNPQDEIIGSTATGFVGHGIDSYTFTGDLESLSVEDGPEVTLNGETIDPDDYR